MFNPWKGSNWGLRSNLLGGVRLLVLGESHYTNPDHPELVGQCVPETTIEVVEDLAIFGRHRFFTGLTQIVSGRPKWQMSREEVQAVWSAIAFANYVPVFVGTGPRIRPTNAMFESGHDPFAEMLADLEPQAIIVCGHALWWWMRRGWLGGANPPVADTCWIGNALAARITHPSGRGFSSTRTRPIVEQLLADVHSTGAMFDAA
jgi:hypothetical protein